MAYNSNVGKLPKGIQYLVTVFIKPRNVLHEFSSVLTKKDREKVRTVVISSGDIDGALHLLEILTTKENWFNSLLRILRLPNVKLQHIAAMMEEEMRVYENAQLSEHAGQNYHTRASACNYITNNNAMEEIIRELFVAYVEPEKVIRAFNKYGKNKVLTTKDIQNVHAEVGNHGKDAGAQLLLERLVLYEDWFNVLLEVLRDPEINLDHVAEKMEEATLCIRQQYEKECTDNFSQDNGETFTDSAVCTRHQYETICRDTFSHDKWNTFTNSADGMEDMANANGEYETDSPDGTQTEDMANANGEYETDSSDGTQTEDMADANGEYETDSSKMICRSVPLTQDHRNMDNILECPSNLPIQTEVSVDVKSGKTELMAAVAAGDCDRLKGLINVTKDINESDINDRTALIYAALKGQAECVELLIKCGCDLNKQDRNGNTALMTACGEGHTECVNILIFKNADVNVANKRGTTALMVATKKGYLDSVRLLLQNGCDPNKPHHDGLTAALYAACRGKVECLKLLIEWGCDINKATIKGQTALMFAAGNGHSDCVKILIDSHCNVNMCDSKGQTALMFAANNGHSACMELLIDGGADIDRTDIERNSAVMYAILHKHIECLKFLISKNANLNITNCFGYTALKFARKKGYL